MDGLEDARSRAAFHVALLRRLRPSHRHHPHAGEGWLSTTVHHLSSLTSPSVVHICHPSALLILSPFTPLLSLHLCSSSLQLPFAFLVMPAVASASDALAPRVYVIHENPVWLPPFAAAFNRLNLPWSEWDMSVMRTFDLSSPPPPGVFYNRMSASSHTRDHRYAAELTVSVLAWLTRHGRRVVNGPGAIDLEISKTRQYAALEAAGLTVPRTVLVQSIDDPEAVVDAAQRFFANQPLILKPNRGGKGFGVHLMASVAALSAFLRSPSAREEAPVDGIWLLQEYIRAERPVITRAEFIGGRFLYAVEVDTSAGFLLCPADECQTTIGDANCPVGPSSSSTPSPSPSTTSPPAPPRFTVLEKGIEEELVRALESFLATVGVDVAGVEFIRTADGAPLVYDLNTNTNYNPAAEEKSGRAGTDASGPGALAKFLQQELANHSVAKQ